jgi:hypothetical protein
MNWTLMQDPTQLGNQIYYMSHFGNQIFCGKKQDHIISLKIGSQLLEQI